MRVIKNFQKGCFFIDKEAGPDNTKITSLKHLLKAANDEELANLKRAPIIRAGWRLKVAKEPGIQQAADQKKAFRKVIVRQLQSKVFLTPLPQASRLWL